LPFETVDAILAERSLPFETVDAISHDGMATTVYEREIGVAALEPSSVKGQRNASCGGSSLRLGFH